MLNKRPKVLIIEDDKFMAHVYSAKIKELGVDTRIIYKGTEVLPVAREEKPHLILLDIILPEKDAFKIIPELKANKETKDIPIVIVSELSRDKDIKEIKQLGASEYIVKSKSSFKNLVHRIEKYFQ